MDRQCTCMFYILIAFGSTTLTSLLPLKCARERMSCFAMMLLLVYHWIGAVVMMNRWERCGMDCSGNKYLYQAGPIHEQVSRG